MQKCQLFHGVDLRDPHFPTMVDMTQGQPLHYPAPLLPCSLIAKVHSKHVPADEPHSVLLFDPRESPMHVSPHIKVPHAPSLVCPILAQTSFNYTQ